MSCYDPKNLSVLPKPEQTKPIKSTSTMIMHENNVAASSHGQESHIDGERDQHIFNLKCTLGNSTGQQYLSLSKSKSG